MISKSKTSCFTIVLKPFKTIKHGTLESKTTCFTMSDVSDISVRNITLRKQLILNRLEAIVMFYQK